MSQENVEIAKRIDALGDSVDIEGVLAYCDPDVEWRDVSPEPGAAERLRGIAELRTMLAPLEKLLNSPFAVEVQQREYIDAGDYVVSLTHSKSLGLDLLDASIYEFKDRKILRLTQGYPNENEALKAVGVAE
jgi:ketosteroid isomerase-like protein